MTTGTSQGASDRTDSESGRYRTDGDSQADHVHLLMTAGEDRELLEAWLATEYSVSRSATLEDVSEFDLCLVGERAFRSQRAALADLKARADPTFLPVLLVAPVERVDDEVWKSVDDVVSTPVKKVELRARLSNLLARRRTSRRLTRRERRLEATAAALQRTRRAMDAAPIGVTITDPVEADNPTVYANAAFERLTGYDREYVLGKNMRLLQGPASDDDAVAAMRNAVDEREPTSVTLLNYRADGTQFWNRVDISPVRDDSGSITNFVGFQTDVTDEKIREQRLSVLNRLMRHNLANDLNVVDGYAEMLLDEIDDPEQVEALQAIKTAAADLQSLGEEARRIERLLGRCRSIERTVDVETILEDVCAAVSDRYPEADLSTDVSGGPWQVTGYGLREVFEELIGNAIEHNETARPSVEIAIVQASSDRIEVRVCDDGPGVAEDIVEMVRTGEETPLKHGDRLGLWLVYWIVTLLGGGFSLSNRSDGGAVAEVTLPVGDAAPSDRRR